MIDEFDAEQAMVHERRLFKQRARLVKAERKLQVEGAKMALLSASNTSIAQVMHRRSWSKRKQVSEICCYIGARLIFGAMMAKVTFLKQNEPIDEYGRALYAVARSVLRALIDSLTAEDLQDLNTPLADVRLRQLAKVIRIERDKGMKGDGFEWAVHEAILGKEPRVLDPIAHALKKASRFVKDAEPSSILFGHERAKYLGFLDATVQEAGNDAYLLPEGSGRPYKFGPWVQKAALGAAGEGILSDRIKKIWKTDLFLSVSGDTRHFAATVKSNYGLLEGGRGLRVGIVPESTHLGNAAGVRWDAKHGLWVVTLADPNGFMGLFADGFHAVGRAICSVGKLPVPPYYIKPSAKAQRVMEQLIKFEGAKVLEVEAALNDAAQQNLIGTSHKLVSVNAPDWLHLKQAASPRPIAVLPTFEKLD
ncbi:hypothetical protein [Variovorax sp. PDC80]|uniref:hypothetical protein n=1 Tax=Variovorax sp. PDC80 TaxID=1882827 RepID=UPI001160871D|nr:hypothetical protein [Variovorax sp. PDC80]